MVIYPPIKEARTWGWQRQIRNLDDLKKLPTQKFGENKLTWYKDMGLLGHNGIDWGYNDGTEVYASHDGVIKFAGIDGAGGLGVDVWDGKSFFTRYWHLKSWIYNVGTPVKAGQLIAYGDNTGMSTGSHLHFGLKLTDNKGNTINKDNGYLGAIDPFPYMRWWEINMLTKEQVEMLQALEGYSDKQGAEYWSGKDLEVYLKTRIKDKIKDLEKYE